MIQTGLQTIVSARIHPAIGIARVGNSATGFFIGPEAVNTSVPIAGTTRDATGALKRQAVRFRIYGYNAAGEAVAEITAEKADVRWTVHVCNKKAHWYRFVMAFDIPEAKDIVATRRNAHLEGKDRDSLILDPGPISISGKDQSGEQLIAPSQGASRPAVYLGQLTTDGQGRLVFLGGRGHSFSPDGKPVWDGSMQSYPSGDGWFDDTCDGPVTAAVVYDGRLVPVEPAWVVTAPPDYAPGLTSVRTLYDLLADTYIRSGLWDFPKRLSFAIDVYPILWRLSRLQWVNKGFATQFGIGGPHDFTNHRYLSKLGSASTVHTELRRQIFNSFRSPETLDSNALPWPWLYGDAMVASGPPASPRQHLSLTLTQCTILKYWADGDFDEDLELIEVKADSFEDTKTAEQPAMLDRAALHYCAADAFHPGCELTWPVRIPSIYKSAFRFRHKEDPKSEPDYGPMLTQEIVLSAEGPLHEQGPGDLTRWLALPWQVSVALCRSGYDPEYDPYVPTFWPALVPNQVLTEQQYEQTIDERLSREDRLRAFAERRPWTRNLRGSLLQQMSQMVTEFSKMGVVEARPGVRNDQELPAEMLVESLDNHSGTHSVSYERAKILQVLVECATREAEHLERSEWAAMQEVDGFGPRD